MTVPNQPPLVGADVVIHCKGEWTCCEREQAQKKVENYNKNAPLKIRDKVTTEMNKEKDKCQAEACAQMDADMKADPAGAAKKYSGGSPCLEKQLREYKPPEKARSGLNLQMDHPVEVKV